MNHCFRGTTHSFELRYILKGQCTLHITSLPTLDDVTFVIARGVVHVGDRRDETKAAVARTLSRGGRPNTRSAS